MLISNNRYSCDQCGKQFERKEKRIHKHQFCSVSCRGKGQDRRGMYPSGPTHPQWNGGRYKSKDGYVWLTVPIGFPGSDNRAKHNQRSSRILEHRKIMQEVLGRTLLRTETVHHKNGIKDDNRPENLELRYGNHGTGFTFYTQDVNRLLSMIQPLTYS